MSLEDLQDEVGEDEDDISDISSESESDSGSESDGLSGDDVRRGLGFGGFAA